MACGAWDGEYLRCSSKVETELLFFLLPVCFVYATGENVDHVFVHYEVVVFWWQELFREVWASSAGKFDLLSKMLFFRQRKRGPKSFGVALWFGWYEWKQIKGYLKPIVVQSWKNWRELESGHPYGPLFLGCSQDYTLSSILLDWKVVVV